MKIPVPEESFFADSNIKEDLRLFLEQPSPQQLAPCPGCQQHTPDDCSSKCTDAAEALSIDPVLYPIEKNVVPLVYELMATQLIQTCWSCEGHMNENNTLWKLPQVCFYTASSAYVKLLCRHIALLNQHKCLKHPWHIVLSEFSMNSRLAYSIQPNLNDVNEPHLGLLQQDLNIIADDLNNKLKKYAKEFLEHP
ncbi:MAG: hypothetical protein KAT25_05610 [Sulfuriflexus sp.]|nr:hypothetical protein [Sulfuriflexus sp.]